jgi:hypothetical protein
VLAEDFERTRAILRGNDEGLLAHVGPDLQCGSVCAQPSMYRLSGESGLRSDRGLYREAAPLSVRHRPRGMGRDTSLKLVMAVRLLQNST